MTPLLLAKLVVAPTFVVLVTLVARRLGPAAAGMLAALPVVAGPILALMVAEQGVAFGREAAYASALGAASTMLFTLSYTHLARRFGAAVSLVAAYTLFGLATLVARAIPLHLAAVVGVPLACWVLVLAVFPVPDAELRNAPASRWDLPARAFATMGLVFVITSVAAALGPKLAGLVAPAPVATAVLAVFTHRQSGPDAVAVLLRSLTRGMLSFCSFLVSTGLLLERLPIPWAFASALGIALIVQGMVIRTGLGVPRAR